MRGMRHGRVPALWIALPLAAVILAVAPARAQFSFFGPREASPEEVSESIASHGFRLAGPLYRNGRVYLADVIDRKQRRERLVISAETGEIVQRFFVDTGPERRSARAATRTTPPPDDSFFSHLTRGWDDAPPPRPPLGLSGVEAAPNSVSGATPPSTRPRTPSRVVTRGEPGPTPVTASPLPPSGTPSPAPPAAANPGVASAQPEVVAVPTGNAPANKDAPLPAVKATSVSSDPLRIPRSRKTESAPAAVPAPRPSEVKAAEAKPAAASPPPAAVKAKAPDVPVAPLD